MEKVKLKDIGTIVTGNTPSKKNEEFYNSKDINFFTPSDFDDRIINELDKSINYISNKAKTKARMLPKDSVLVTCIGIIGKVGIIQKESAFNQQINAIIPNERIINRYLSYWLISQAELLRKKANAPVVPIINKKDFQELEIKLISLKEQEQIVSKLDKLQEIINLRKKQIQRLDELEKSQFIKMFENEKYPQKSLINVCEELFAGGDVNKEHTSKERTDKYKYPIYTNSEKLDGLYGYTDIVRVNKEAVTISSRGTIGFCCIRKVAFYPAVRLIVAVPNKNIIDTIFLRQFIENKNYGGQGASIPQLTVPMIKNELIPIPPIELQKEFADIVKQIYKQKFRIQKNLEQMQILQESLMNKYFN